MRRAMMLFAALLLVFAPLSAAAPPQEGDWVVEPIATGNDGLFAYFSSVAVDPGGDPVVLYNDEDASLVRMATPGPAGWTVSTAAEEAGYYCRLAYDGAGLLHGAYVTGDGHLRYGTHDGGWAWQTVGDVGDGVYLDMALDSAGRPYLAHINGLSGMLRCLWYDGAAWQDDPIAQVGIDIENFRELGIALDDDDVPHISAPYEPGGAACKLIHATVGTEGWGFEIVDASSNRGKSSDILVASDGTIHMTYRESTGNDLRHAWFDGSWHTASLDSAGDVGYHTSLALDGDGCVNVAYYDRESDRLRHAWLDGDTWRTQTLNAIGACRDGFTSLVFDGLGQPHIMAVQGVAGASRELNHVLYSARFAVMLPLITR